MPEKRLPSALSLIINQYTDTFLKRARGAIKVPSLISDYRLDDLIDRKLLELENIDVDYKKVCEENDSILWNFSAVREMKRRKIKGNFLALQRGESVKLITGQSTKFLNDCILYLAKKLYPELIMAYITSEEIYEILEHLSNVLGTELLYTKYVAKKMFGKAFTSIAFATKREPKTYDPYTQAFKEARIRGLWIDAIRVFSKGTPTFGFNISRSGILKYYRGNFEEYHNLILSKISAYYTQRLKSFEKRGRIDHPRKEPSPLLMKFDTNVFEDVGVRKQLINVIGNYDYCSYSVIYGGNPHVYVSVVDRIDNSSFSLRTYGPDSLIIVPQIRTTKAALMRFSKHLLDNFREGKLSDFMM